MGAPAACPCKLSGLHQANLRPFAAPSPSHRFVCVLPCLLPGLARVRPEAHCAGAAAVVTGDSPIDAERQHASASVLGPAAGWQGAAAAGAHGQVSGRPDEHRHPQGAFPLSAMLPQRAWSTSGRTLRWRAVLTAGNSAARMFWVFVCRCSHSPQSAASTRASGVHCLQALGAVPAAALRGLSSNLPPGADLHHAVLAVYGLLLLRYSRQDDLCIAAAFRGKQVLRAHPVTSPTRQDRATEPVLPRRCLRCASICQASSQCARWWRAWPRWPQQMQPTQACPSGIWPRQPAPPHQQQECQGSQHPTRCVRQPS